MNNLIQIKGITELEYPLLYQAVKKYMDRYNIEKIEIKILETGMKADAIAHVIRISKKLIKMMNGDEIEAIVAHELSHIKNRDFIVKLPFVFILIPLLIIFLYAFIISYLYKVSFEHDILLLLILFFSIIILMIVLRLVLIRQELNADRESAIKTGKPDSMKSALVKMYSERFPRRRLIEKLDWYYYNHITHPNLKKRIECLELHNMRNQIHEHQLDAQN